MVIAVLLTSKVDDLDGGGWGKNEGGYCKRL